MNLVIIGNSITFRKKVGNTKIPKPKTFVDILFEKYNIPEHDHLYSYACCSEERILYFLKKIKEIDIVVIFHAVPEFFFVPTLERDFTAMNEDDYFWKDPHWNNINVFPSIATDTPITPAEWEILRTQHKSTNPYNTISNEEFKNYFYSHLKYFYTNDLCHTRHFGALAQIDQYITYKKIPVIHCTLPRSLPTWFKFSSGIVDTEIATFQFSNHPNHCSHAKVRNAIDEEGNKIIANKLISYIEQLVGETGIEPI